MSHTAPARNVEIKARLNGKLGYDEKVKIAKALTGTSGKILLQHDTFFNSKSGRLKLRYLVHKPSELIYYNRPDSAEPKLSEFHKIDLNEPETMEVILCESIGVKGRVKKERLLFMHENTRIHLDIVENLGHFLEFEACLSPSESTEDGQTRLDSLLKTFKIEKEDLIQGSYMDELLNKENI